MKKTPHPLSKTILKQIKSSKEVNPPKGYTKFDVRQAMFADALLRDSLIAHEGDLAYHEELVPNVAAHMSDYMTKLHMYAPRSAYIVCYYTTFEEGYDDVVFTYLAQGEEVAVVKSANRLLSRVFEATKEKHSLDSKDELEISVTPLETYLSNLLMAGRILKD